MEYDFGDYAILDNARYTLEKMPNWWWDFKPPDISADIIMSKFMVSNRVAIGPDGTTRNDPPTVFEIAVKELTLLFGGTNIGVRKDGDKPFISPDEPHEAVFQKIGKMPRALVWEIWTAMGEKVPGWGKAPEGEGDDPKEEAEES